MFRRKLNKALAIVVAIATVATSTLPSAVYSAEIDNAVVVETEDAVEVTEEAAEETSEVVEDVDEVAQIVAEETTDDQETTDEVVEATEEVIDEQVENVSEHSLAATDFTANATYNILFDEFKVFDPGWNTGGTVSLDEKKFTSTKQYGQIYLNLPEGIDSKRVSQIEVVVDSVENFSVKVCNGATDIENLAVYGQNTINLNGGKSFSTIALMSTAETEKSYSIDYISITLIDAPAVEEIGNGTLNIPASNITVGTTWGCSYDSETGKITYTAQYDQFFVALPSGVDSRRVSKVVVNSSAADNCEIALKATDGSGNQISVAYSNVIEFQNPTEFTYIDIMCNATTEPLTYTIDSIDITLIDAPAEENDNEKTYTFESIGDAFVKQNADYELNEDGSIKVEFIAQYGQILFRIPEELDDETIESVTWNLSKGSGRDGISVKIHTEEDANSEQRSGDVGVAYGSNVVPANSNGKAARYIAIMTTSVPSEDEPIYMSFDSVKIVVKEKGRKIVNNILDSFNGSFENTGYWSDGRWSQDFAQIVEYSDDDPAVNSKVGAKYFKVVDPTEDDSDKDNDYNLPTALMNQEVGIVPGGTYEFSYWARLDSNTANVENPEIKFAIQLHNNSWSGSMFAEIEYDGNNVLTDKWTNYTGAIILDSSSDSFLNEAKISFQTAAGVGFSLDDIKIGETVIPGVQKDIPDFHEKVAQQGIPMSGVAISSNTLVDEMAMELVFKHFNSISCENAMKPDQILGNEPAVAVDSVDDLDLHFEEAEKTCDAIQKHNVDTEDDIKMRGHVFIWHSQTPSWFFKEGFKSSGKYVSKAVMNQRIDDYIRNVAEHFDNKYPGLIYAWDVVNEQASDGSGIRTGTDWYAIYGGSDEYIIQAFKSADKYLAKDTILFYNDYNECNPSKCNQICSFLTKIKANISPDRKLGAGMQGHHDMADPDAETIESAVRAYAEIADVIHVTELDIKSTMGFDGTDLEAEAIANGKRYRQIYDILKTVNEEYNNEKVQCVTIWGTHDPVSWLKTSNNVGGSADGKTPQYPLIFDDNYKAKPAYWAIIDPEGSEYPAHKVDPLPEEPQKPDEITVYKGAETIKDATAHEMGETDVYIDFDDDGKVVELKAEYKIVVDDEGKLSILVETFGYDDLGISVKVDGDTFVSFEKKAIKGGSVIEPNDGYGFLFEDISSEKDIIPLEIETIILDTDYQDLNISYKANVNVKERIEIKRATINVDGKIDNAWNYYGGDAKTLDIASAEGLASGAVKYLWDEEYLYVLMSVVDDTIDVSARDAYQQDSIEIFIDENNHKTASYEDDDKQYRVSATNVQSFNGKKCVAQNIKSAVVRTASGYVLEAAIAWTDITPYPNTCIGLDIQINDGKNGARVGTVNMFNSNDDGYQSTANYGTAILTGEEDTEDLDVQVIDSQLYTGKAVKPSVVVRHKGKKLVAGKDYTLSYKNNINVANIVGTGIGDGFDSSLPTVIITGKGNFNGNVKANFAITKAIFGGNGFDISYKDSAVESSKATNPDITVKYNKITVPKSAYTVTYYSETEEELTSIPANKPGTYLISLKAKDDSNFTGTVDLTYKVIPKTNKKMSALSVSLSSSKFNYTGEEIKPTVVVKDGKKTVLANSDDGYNIEYTNNLRPGTGKVVITGTGKYYGSVTKTFTIKGTPVKNLKVSLDKTSWDYTGSGIEPAITVKDGTTKLNVVENDLENGYKYVITNNVNPGTATITITGCGKYTGSVKKTFTIKGTAVSKLNITVGKTEVMYNGSAIKPSVEVLDGENPVTILKGSTGSGVKVDYSNNTNPGTATITITGYGKYTGSVKKTFKIVGLDMKNTTVTYPTKLPYKGKTYNTIDVSVDYNVKNSQMAEYFSTEEVTVKVGDSVTLDPANYTVTLVKGGLNVGEATYKIAGKGIFYGSKTIKVKIEKLDVSKNASLVTMKSISDITYGQYNNKPDVEIRFNSRMLKKGVDYTVAYTKNTKVTDAAVATVTLKGNYKGTLKGTYKITPAQINDSYVATANDVIANTKKGTYKSTVVVKNPSGKKLVDKTDYSVKYYISSVADENLITSKNLASKKSLLKSKTPIIAVVEGKNNYTGSISATYYLVDVMASSISVSIKSKNYTGSKININKDDITATVKVGGETVDLIYGYDYTIKYLGDQTQTGKQKIELVPFRGCDSRVYFYGTKSTTYTIKSKTMKWSDKFFASVGL